MGEKLTDRRDAVASPPAPAHGAPAAGDAAKPDDSAALPLLTCPSCSRRFRRRRAIVRRSSAECPACKKLIWIDPFQRLYPGQVCLSEEQAQYVGFLMRLADMWCGADLLKYLDAVRASMTDASGAAPSAAQILQRLLMVARGRCVDRDEEQSLRELSRDFKRFQRKLRQPAASPSPLSSLAPLRQLLRVRRPL